MSDVVARNASCEDILANPFADQMTKVVNAAVMLRSQLDHSSSALAVFDLQHTNVHPPRHSDCAFARDFERLVPCDWNRFLLPDHRRGKLSHRDRNRPGADRENHAEQNPRRDTRHRRESSLAGLDAIDLPAT